LEELAGRVQSATEKSTRFVPIGSVGGRTPSAAGVDSIVALEVAKRVAAGRKLLIAPLITVTYSEWHMGFPGTLSISLSTLTQVLRETCEDLVEHGFRRIMFINSHVGNDPAIMEVAHELIRRSAARVAWSTSGRSPTRWARTFRS
jgi:creatinine amidohydrolase